MRNQYTQYKSITVEIELVPPFNNNGNALNVIEQVRNLLKNNSTIGKVTLKKLTIRDKVKGDR